MNIDRYATRYTLPYYEDMFTETDDCNIRREVSRCQVFVEYRGNGLWCVVDGMHNNYSRDGSGLYEPMSSNRTQEFLDQFRFPKAEAMVIAAKVLPGVTESILSYAAIARDKAIETGKLEHASFYTRTIDLIERGVREVQAELLEEA